MGDIHSDERDRDRGLLPATAVLARTVGMGAVDKALARNELRAEKSEALRPRVLAAQCAFCGVERQVDYGRGYWSSTPDPETGRRNWTCDECFAP